MGSPLSPVLANMFMEHLEEKAIKSSPLKPSLWAYGSDMLTTYLLFGLIVYWR